MREKTISELNFEWICYDKNIPFRDSTKEENMFDHIDYVFNNESVDIKELGKVDRNGKYDKYHKWVELVNVNGEIGSCVGKADWIGYEIKPFYYMLVDRKELYSMVWRKWYENGNKIGKNLYEFYRRSGNEDVIMLIRTKDLIGLKHKIIKR